jgi:hypothetical protein
VAEVAGSRNSPQLLRLPTEIFPSEMRTQGNGFGITGWAIGVGWTVLVNPIMFAHLESRTYFLFAGLNLPWIPIVFFFYPETAHRSLESIEAMFSSSSPFYTKMEAAYRAVGNGDVLAARRLSLANPSENAKRFAIQEKAALCPTRSNHKNFLCP